MTSFDKISLDEDLNFAVGKFIGLAIGDAMGAPIEFQPAREPIDYVRSYQQGGFHNVSKGEFTDDTSMALAMADAFIEAKSFNPKLIMDNFLKWKNEGAYSNECCVSGYSVEPALHAAHIQDYSVHRDNSINNGLALRADIHILFDRGLIKIYPDFSIWVSMELKNTAYWEYNGKDISLPAAQLDWPSKLLLSWKADFKKPQSV